MLSTRFTETVGCTVPIQNAGMGELSTPDLAMAVAAAGGLGMIGTPMVPPEVLRQRADRLAAAPGVTGINFLVEFTDLACVEIAASRVRVVEFFYGAPDAELVARAHQGGALVSWQVGDADEGRAAQDAGCDLIIAQSVEAGGHVRGKLALLPLLDGLLDAVDIPVLAAGGIATPRAVAAALAAGADGVRVGTRFVAAAEADAHPLYVDALLAARGEDAVYTEAFSGLWPVPHRVLRSCITAAEGLADETIGEATIGGSRMAIPRFSAPPPGRDMTGHPEAAALYAGQGVGSVTTVEAAADIVRALSDGAADLLARRSQTLLRHDRAVQLV